MDHKFASIHDQHVAAKVYFYHCTCVRVLSCMSEIWPLRSEECEQTPMINGYKKFGHIANYNNVLREAKSATRDLFLSVLLL